MNVEKTSRKCISRKGVAILFVIIIISVYLVYTFNISESANDQFVEDIYDVEKRNNTVNNEDNIISNGINEEDIFHRETNKNAVEEKQKAKSELNVEIKKKVLLWTTFYEEIQPHYISLEDNCPKRCEITPDKNELNTSDAILFNLRDIHAQSFPKFRHPYQRWVILNNESPPYTPSLKALDGLINWTITYYTDSDITVFPLATRRNIPRRRTQAINYFQNKTNDIFWFVSNCHTSSNRETFVEELEKTIKVDIVGGCGKMKCSPSMSEACYEEFSRKYKFYLAFENTLCKDYVTEKFFNIIKHDVIPVVFNGADMTRMAPNHSYINALDFESPTELGKYLLELSADEERYNEYFKWREEYTMDGFTFFCQLCVKLHDPNEPVKVWRHLHEWYFGDANCHSWHKQ